MLINYFLFVSFPSFEVYTDLE